MEEFPPAVQKLTYHVACRSIWWLPLLLFVYHGDILIVGSKRFVGRAVRRARHRLTKAGFIISHNFETELARHMDFMGNIFDPHNETLANRQGYARGFGEGVVSAGVGFAEKKGYRATIGTTAVGLAPRGGTPPFLGRGVMLEAYLWHWKPRTLPSSLPFSFTQLRMNTQFSLNLGRTCAFPLTTLFPSHLPRAPSRTSVSNISRTPNSSKGPTPPDCTFHARYFSWRFDGTYRDRRVLCSGTQPTGRRR